MRVALRGVALISLVMAASLLRTQDAVPAEWGPGDLGPGADVADGQLTAWVISSASGEVAASTTTAARPGQGGITMYCYYYGLTPAGTGYEPTPDLAAGPVWPPVPGDGYILRCVDPDGDQVHAELVIYDPGDPFGTLDDAYDAAEIALTQLTLPAPAVGLAPPTGTHLVGLPSWYWTTTPWEPVTTTATLGATASTVTATPTALTIDPGDGTPAVTCDGPGVPWAPGRTNPPPCGHTYQRSGTYTLTVTIDWVVTWTATTGQGGPFPAQTTTATATLVAQQAQAVLTD